MNRKGQISELVKEIVIGFGVMEGIWLRLGFSPESLVIQAFEPILKSVNSPTSILILLKILPILVMLLTLAGVFYMGEWLGLIAVALGVIGGYILLSSPIVGLIFIGIGLIAGYFAFQDNS